MDIYKVFARWLRTERFSQRITQTELANKCKIKRSTIANIELCKQSVSLNTFCDLVTALGEEPYQVLKKICFNAHSYVPPRAQKNNDMQGQYYEIFQQIKKILED